MSCRVCPPDGSAYCLYCAALATRAGVVLSPPRPTLTLPVGVSEATMQDKLRGGARGLGYLYYHTHMSKRSDPGWPDTAIVRPDGGALYLWEVKRADGEVSTAQQRWLDALTRVTHVEAGVYYPADWSMMRDVLARGAPSR